MNNIQSKNAPKIKSLADVEKYLGSLPCGKFYIDKSDADERLSIFKEPVDPALKCGHIHIMICRRSNPSVQLTPCYALWYHPGRTCAESNPDKTYRHKALSYVYEFRKLINNYQGIIRSR